MDNAPKEFFQSFDLLRLRSVEEQQNFLRLILQYTPSLYPTIGCPYSTDNMVMAAAANIFGRDHWLSRCPPNVMYCCRKIDALVEKPEWEAEREGCPFWLVLRHLKVEKATAIKYPVAYKQYVLRLFCKDQSNHSIHMTWLIPHWDGMLQKIKTQLQGVVEAHTEEDIRSRCKLPVRGPHHIY